MLLEATFGVLSVGPAMIWALALLWTGRARRQPALTAYLAFSSLCSAALLYGKASGLVSSESTYLYLYVGNGLGSLALLAAAFLEIAALSLIRFPRFQRAGSALVNGLLTTILAATLALAVIPLEWTRSISGALFGGTSFVYASLGMVWIVFALAGRYFRLTLDHRPRLEGWTLACIALSFALFLGWTPEWYRVGVVLVSALGFGAGAAICLASSKFSESTLALPEGLSHTDALAVRQTLSRLDIVEQGLAIASKG